VHHLREALNSRPIDAPITVDFFEKVDAPVLAAVAKLWLLELDPPVGTWDGWDDFRKVYPSSKDAFIIKYRILLIKLHSGC
jgi:hypothetical protein